MVAAHLINIHVYSSIIATIALIALFVFKKGEREHIVLGYLYSLFSFITVLTIIITSALFMFGRWLDHKPFILFVGRFSDLILILLFLAQLFTGLVFIQLKDSWKTSQQHARTFVLISRSFF